MQFTEQQISAVARVLSNRAAFVCNVDKDDNWNIYSQDYIDDAKAALSAISAAPQVVADERAAVLEEAACAVEARKVGYPSYFEIDERLQQAADEVRALAAAPVQAQEPVAYIWSVNGMVKTGGDSVFNDHEKFYRALVQVHEPVPEAAQQNGGLVRAALIDLMALERQATSACDGFKAQRDCNLRFARARKALADSADVAPAAQGDKK